ncbi:MAG: hypothetical protein ACO3MD_09375 [Candidatus Nanopelagicales bacterium]
MFNLFLLWCVVIALVVLRNKWAAPSALGSLAITSIFVAFA